MDDGVAHVSPSKQAVSDAWQELQDVTFFDRGIVDHGFGYCLLEESAMSEAGNAYSGGIKDSVATMTLRCYVLAGWAASGWTIPWEGYFDLCRE